MKTCNGAYCQYKSMGGCYWVCNYEGYCDYQCPKDSRAWEIKPVEEKQP